MHYQDCNRTYELCSRNHVQLTSNKRSTFRGLLRGKCYFCRSPSLKVLDLVNCAHISYEGLAEVIPRYPLLEKIVLSGYKYMERDVYQVIGKTCTQLKRLELHDGSREQTLGIAALQGLQIGRAHV